MPRVKFLARPRDLAVIAVPFGGGQAKRGVDAGPDALIEAGLLDQLRDDLGYTVLLDDSCKHVMSKIQTEGDDEISPGMRGAHAVSEINKKVYERVYRHASLGSPILTLGGDHSIGIGSVAGVSRAARETHGREIAVVWVDAHADINRPEDSKSGNLHGMPLAFLTGIVKPRKTEEFGWLSTNDLVNPERLVYIGLRDVDRAEKRLIREMGIKAFSMHDIDKYGIGRVMEMVLQHIGADTPIHLSVDIDSLDPSIASSTGTPVYGGLTMREGGYICESIWDTGNLIAMDLVEINPILGQTSPGLRNASALETVRAGCSLVRCAFGESLL